MAYEVLDYQGLDYFKYKLQEYILNSGTGVKTFNNRTGNVVPQSGDYTAAMVGAVPTTRTVNGKALSSDITLAAADVSAVPTTRTVNGKALSSNITLSASDVSAVPTTRTVNGKALSSNITLTADDIGASSITTPVSIANGGTGATTASSAIYELTSPLTERSAYDLHRYKSSTYFPCVQSTTSYQATLESIRKCICAIEYVIYDGTGESTKTLELPITSGVFFIMSLTRSPSNNPDVGVSWIMGNLLTGFEYLSYRDYQSIGIYSGASAGITGYKTRFYETTSTSGICTIDISDTDSGAIHLYNNAQTTYVCYYIGIGR